MDPSGVLLALEEQKKWRERHKRIRERIRQLDRRRSLLKKELDGVRNKILQYGRVLIDLHPSETVGVPAGRRERFASRHLPWLSVLLVAAAVFLTPLSQGDLQHDAPMYAWFGYRDNANDVSSRRSGAWTTNAIAWTTSS